MIYSVRIWFVFHPNFVQAGYLPLTNTHMPKLKITILLCPTPHSLRKRMYYFNLWIVLILRRRQIFNTTIPTKTNLQDLKTIRTAETRPVGDLHPSQTDTHRREREEEKLRKSHKHKRENRETILNSIMVEEEEK